MTSAGGGSCVRHQSLWFTSPWSPRCLEAQRLLPHTGTTTNQSHRQAKHAAVKSELFFLPERSALELTLQLPLSKAAQHGALRNGLTSIPPAVFSMKKLRTLLLRHNPIRELTLNDTEFEFLSNLDNLYLGPNMTIKAKCAQPKNLTDTLSGVAYPVCIQKFSSNGNGNDKDNASSSSNSSSKSNVGMIVGIIAGVVVALLAILGFVFWKRRQQQARHHLSDPQSPQAMSIPQDKRATDTMPSTSNPVSSRDVELDDFLASDEVLAQHRVAVADIQELRELGVGAFGIVWLVSYRGVRLASKRLKPHGVTRDQARKFLDEVRLTARLDHANIVQFIGLAYTHLEDVQGLYEYMENGDLRKWLARSDAATGWTNQKFQIAIDIIHALVYVHSFSPPIVHRDLKSSNVLLDQAMTAKLCDFGVSRFESSQQTMTMGVGTSFWLAPEVISGRGDYGCHADIYSFGVLLSELDTHTIPYQGVKTESGQQVLDIAIIHQVGMGVLSPSFNASCPPQVLALARNCLAFDPTNRPSAVEIAHQLNELKRKLCR